MNTRILNEAKRAFGCLEQMDPQDVDVYSKLVETIDELTTLGARVDEDWSMPWWNEAPAESKGEELPGQTRIEEVLREPTPTQPEAEVPYEEPESPFPEPVELDRVALRKRLATAQKNGINVAKVVSDLGATGFTKLPDEKLPALDEALKELGY